MSEIAQMRMADEIYTAFRRQGGIGLMRLLLTGASGRLGGYLIQELGRQGIPLVAWSGRRQGEFAGVPLQPVDLAEPDTVASAFHQARPTAIIHAGAVSGVADCYRNPRHAEMVNTQASTLLAELAAASGARLVFVSTDLVFDGERGGYREEDATAPLSVYGRTKAAAEQAVRSFPRTVVARVSLLYGPTLIGQPSFFDEQVTALQRGRPCRLFADEWRTPLSLRAAAQALVALAGSDYAGLLHLGGPERLSRLEMGQRLAAFLGADPSLIIPVSRESSLAAEPRPRDTSLDSSRWRADFPTLPWPTWEEALRQMTVP